MSNSKYSPQVGDKFLLDTFLGGNREVARVLAVHGRWFKKYECAVWGESKTGLHQWPNGNVSSFTNFLTKKDLTEKM